MDTSQRKSTRSHKPVSYVELDEIGNSNSPKVDTPPVAEMEPPKDLPQIVPIVRTPPQIGKHKIAHFLLLKNKLNLSNVLLHFQSYHKYVI